MCVAVYVPKEVNKPSTEIMKKCWDTNPDGAGVAYCVGGRVQITKGFMKWEHFKKFYESMNISSPLFLHFRIATAGNVDAGNTHPFPIVNKFKEMRLTHGSFKEVIMHNGVLPIKPSETHVSDTMELSRLLSKLNYQNLNKEALDALLAPLIGSNKLAFINGMGDVRLVGDWQEQDGVWYSNKNWAWKSNNWGRKYSKYTKLWGKDDQVEDDNDETVFTEFARSEDEKKHLQDYGLCPWCLCRVVYNGKGTYTCTSCGIDWKIV